MSAIFYVYTYRSLTSNNIIWVGKGKATRYLDHIKGRSCNRILKAHIKRGEKYDIQLVEQNMTEQAALKLETQLIKHYGRVCNNTGTLYNLTTGGEGQSGSVYTERDIIRRYPNRRITVLENIQTGAVKTWQSLGLAAKELNVPSTSIWSLLEGRVQTLNKTWKIPGRQLDKYKEHRRPLSVSDTLTGKTYSFASQLQASKELGVTFSMINQLSRQRVKHINRRYILGGSDVDLQSLPTVGKYRRS